MSIWWIFIVIIMVAILVFVIKYSSRSESKLEEKNAALDRRNKLSASLDLKTRVKNGTLGVDEERQKIVYLIDTDSGFITKEFDFKEVESFELLLDDEVLFRYPGKDSTLEQEIASIRGVITAYLVKASILRGDVGSLDLKIVFHHSSDPYYLFNFYSKRVGAKSVLEMAIHSIEDWGDHLLKMIWKREGLKEQG